MSGIMRTRDVVVADAWANDDGGVSLEFEGNVVPVTPEEAILFALSVFAAAVDAAEAIDEKAEAEITLTELGERALITRWDPYAEPVVVVVEPQSWAGRL